MALFKDTNLQQIVEGKGLYEKAAGTGARTAQNYNYLNPSNREPFLTTPLPEIYNNDINALGILGGNTDFVLRAGTLRRSLNDVSRLTKFFTTGKGGLFIAKQNLLSRTGVKTEASGILNEGAYLPTSTLAQVAANGLGGHLNKQGLNPFRNTQGENQIFGLQIPNVLGLPAYVSAFGKVKETDTNRLVKFYNNKIITNNVTDNFSTNLRGFLGNIARVFSPDDNDNTLYSYSGGPGSQVGVGRTQIRMSPEQRTGRSNIKLFQSGFFSNADTPSKIDPKVKFKKFSIGSVIDNAKNKSSAILGGAISNNVQGEISFLDYSVFNRSLYNLPSVELRANQIINPNSSVSLTYQNLTGENTQLDQTEGGIVDQTGNKLLLKDQNVYKDGLNTNTEVAGDSTLTQEQIRSKERNQSNKILPDFRQEIENQPKTLDYERQNIEQRVGLGDPGKKGIVDNYENGKRSPGSQKSFPVDKITALPLYKSYGNKETGAIGGPTSSTNKNDLVKFRIAAVDSANPTNSVYMHFRAFLGSFNDSYNASWEAQQYMGRAESFYKYGGFDRTIAMNWTVPAQSKNELMIMYQKLNYLASNLAPDYVNNRYMGGPLVRLTVGGYLYEQYGFIENLTYNIPEQSPWEIAVPSPESTSATQGVSDDKSVKEMPHIIEVSGFTFRPIHDFVPQKQKNTYEGDLIGSNKTLSQYGLQRYIALAASKNASGYNVDLTNPIKGENTLANVGLQTQGVQPVNTPGIQKIPIKIKP